MDKSILYPPLDLLNTPISQWYGTPKNDTVKQYYIKLGITDGKGNPIHNGIDFACPMGTKIYASHDAVAEVSTGSDGNKKISLWGDGFRTFYCHLSDFKINDNQEVNRGQLIGYSGNSGKYTTGAHLHFGCYLLTSKISIKNYNNGSHGSVNPVPYLAQKLKNGTLMKNNIEPKVFEIKYGRKWWIFDEETYYKWRDCKVGKEHIELVDLITFNNYKWGGVIGKK